MGISGLCRSRYIKSTARRRWVMTIWRYTQERQPHGRFRNWQENFKWNFLKQWDWTELSMEFSIVHFPWNCLTHTSSCSTNCKNGFTVPTCFGCKTQPSSGSHKCWNMYSVLYRLSNASGKIFIHKCHSINIQYYYCHIKIITQLRYQNYVNSSIQTSSVRGFLSSL